MPDTLTERIRNGSSFDHKLNMDLCDHFDAHHKNGSSPDLLGDLNACLTLARREFPGDVSFFFNGAGGKCEAFISNARGAPVFKGEMESANPFSPEAFCRVIVLALLEASG